MGALFICLYGICFNPQHVQYMLPKDNNTSCRLFFHNSGDAPFGGKLIEDKSCGQVIQKIGETIKNESNTD